MSSMRSASSSTRMLDAAQIHQLALEKSHRRPGVAMMTCAPLRMACNWAHSLSAADDDGGAETGAGGDHGEGSLIWIASSRVGLRMRAQTPVGWLFATSDSKQRQHESKRLAGAGLRRGDHIAAGQRGRNGLRLHRRSA